MISSIISRLVILVFGTLYPAYASYKAVRTKNVKEYVKWMMYWIVFALFTCAETFTDVFLSWFPFYYEIKIILVIWLLSPATKGSSILYRKFVHPMLSRREQEIDEYISKAKEQSYKQVLDLGSKGVNVLMQTAIKGGGGLVNQLRKSYSLSDLTDSINQSHEERDETDVLTDSGLLRKKRVHLAASTSSGLYFSEVDVRQDVITHVQSVEDISSGYSSGEALFSGQLPKAREGLVRSGSIGSSRSRSGRITRSTTVPRKATTTESDENGDDASREELSDSGLILISKQKPKTKAFVRERSESSSEGEFLDVIEQNEHTLVNLSIENIKNQCQEAETAPNLTTDKSKLNFEHIPVNLSNENIQKKCQDIESSLSNLNIEKLKQDQITQNIERISDVLNNDFKDSKPEVSLKEEIDTQAVISSKFVFQAEEPVLYKSKSISAINITEVESPQPTPNQEVRAGKYKKKAAPLPPTNKEKEEKVIKESKKFENDNNEATIKATLVLTPGTVRKIGPPTDKSLKSEVFVPSPKLKRKSRSKSPAKQESPLARFMMLSKKLHFWHKDEDNHVNPGDISEIKRSSWYAELPKSSHLLLINSKPISKSAENVHIKKLKHSPQFRNKAFHAEYLGLDSDSD